MLHVKGGMLVTAEGSKRADILCGPDGKIAHVASTIETPTGCDVVDAAGLLVMPGALTRIPIWKCLYGHNCE